MVEQHQKNSFQKREQFAISLRKEKKQKILESKRTKLLATATNYLQNQQKPSQTNVIERVLCLIPEFHQLNPDEKIIILATNLETKLLNETQIKSHTFLFLIKAIRMVIEEEEQQLEEQTENESGLNYMNFMTASPFVESLVLSIRTILQNFCSLSNCSFVWGNNTGDEHNNNRLNLGVERSCECAITMLEVLEVYKNILDQTEEEISFCFDIPDFYQSILDCAEWSLKQSQIDPKIAQAIADIHVSICSTGKEYTQQIFTDSQYTPSLLNFLFNSQTQQILNRDTTFILGKYILRHIQPSKDLENVITPFFQQALQASENQVSKQLVVFLHYLVRKMPETIDRLISSITLCSILVQKMIENNNIDHKIVRVVSHLTKSENVQSMEQLECFGYLDQCMRIIQHIEYLQTQNFYEDEQDDDNDAINQCEDSLAEVLWSMSNFCWHTSTCAIVVQKQGLLSQLLSITKWSNLSGQFASSCIELAYLLSTIISNILSESSQQPSALDTNWTGIALDYKTLSSFADTFIDLSLILKHQNALFEVLKSIQILIKYEEYLLKEERQRKIKQKVLCSSEFMDQIEEYTYTKMQGQGNSEMGKVAMQIIQYRDKIEFQI